MERKSLIFTKEFDEAVTQVCEKDYSKTSESLEKKFGSRLKYLSQKLEEQKNETAKSKLTP